jgi:tetratricopeptide (TPR) repeat protein
MTPVQLQNLLQQGVAHHRAGRLDEAGACYARARAGAPRSFDAWHLAGVVALQQGRGEAAAGLLRRATALNPRSAPAAMRLGLALLAAGRAPEAEAPLRAAVALDPASGEAWDNLAYGLKALDRLPAALAAHERALALRPRQASAWYNYGLTLAFAGRVDDALAAHRRAQAEDPGYARAVFGQAQALQQANRLRDAVAAYDDYLAREPRHTEAMSYRLFALQSLDGVARADLHAAHVAYGRAVGVRPVPVFPHEPAPDRRLRLAILSPDLREHSCAYFLEPLLAHLDPAAFELVLYHDHFRHDAVSDRLRARAAVWRNFVGRPAGPTPSRRRSAPTGRTCSWTSPGTPASSAASRSSPATSRRCR